MKGPQFVSDYVTIHKHLSNTQNKISLFTYIYSKFFLLLSYVYVACVAWIEISNMYKAPL